MDDESARSYFILFVHLILIIKIPTTLSKTDHSRHTDCGKEFVCGSLRYIKYPFWGENRPTYCGKLAYKLDCVNGTIPVIQIKSLSYKVMDIDIYAQTITVARMDYQGQVCPSSLISTTIDFTFFNYTSGTQNVTLGYGCPLNNYGPRATVSGYNCTINNTRTNVVYDPEIECNRTILIPVFDDVVRDLNRSQISLVDGLDKGFALKWYVESQQCKDCRKSGGSCGTNDDSSFICYCHDGPSPAGLCSKRPGISFARLNFFPFPHF